MKFKVCTVGQPSDPNYRALAEMYQQRIRRYVDMEMVSVRPERQESRSVAEIRIRDTGKGVPRRLRDKIFKVAITAESGHQGLGIGSLLVTTLIEENGGKIELEKPGPGDTTVLIRLPIGRQARKK